MRRGGRALVLGGALPRGGPLHPGEDLGRLGVVAAATVGAGPASLAALTALAPLTALAVEPPVVGSLVRATAGTTAFRHGADGTAGTARRGRLWRVVPVILRPAVTLEHP